MTAVRPNSQPQLHCSTRARRLLITAAVVAAAALAHPIDAAPPEMPAAADIAASVREVAPAGWTVQVVSENVLPSGWQSAHTSAVILQVGDGAASRQLAFVPLDWIGAQSKGARIDPVLAGDFAKVIVPGGAEGNLAWLAAVAPRNASLESPTGTTEYFAGQYIAVEARVRALLRRGGPPREQVVASCIALGVPAEDLIRESAVDVRSPSRLAAIRSLRHFPGKATRDALHRIIADKSREPAADTCRLAALDVCESLLIDGHGTAVLLALQAEKDVAVAARLAEEINRIRFPAAAGELRRWLKVAPSLEEKLPFARALATVRDSAAAADIEAALSAPAPRRAAVAPSSDGAARRQLELELHRLTGTWGPAQRGVRMSVTIASPDRVAIHVENMGQDAFRYIPFANGSGLAWPIGLEVSLDGGAISPSSPRDADLGRTSEIARAIAPGTSACFELTVPGGLPAGRTLTARWFGLPANEVVLSPAATAPAQVAPAS